MRESDIDAALR